MKKSGNFVFFIQLTMFHISEVTQADENTFIGFPHILYKNDPTFIAPLQNEIKKIFDPAANSFFQHGHCTRWLLYNNDKKLVGRIAAFINLEKAHTTGISTGGIGFFECINNQD